MESLHASRKLIPRGLASRQSSAGFTPRRRGSAGFTLIELLVVAAIITVLTGIIFTGQSSFNKTMILANTAYDFALSLQSAETYGLGARSIGMTPVGYGIHIDSTHANSFTFFADTIPAINPSDSGTDCHPHTLNAVTLATQPGDCKYVAGSDPIVSSTVFGNGITIVNVEAGSSVQTWSEAGNAHGVALTALDIVFARPNPTPLMMIAVNGAYKPFQQGDFACIEFKSPQGGVRYVIVTPVGQVTASATPCM